MKILVIGSGGREHALCWKLHQSPRVTGLYCAPGNAGTEALGRNVPISITDIARLAQFARDEGIGLTVVGPDDALAAGIVDHFQSLGLRIFGPTREGARFESSKSYAKQFMERHGIPTAQFGEFTDSAEAQKYCQRMRYPLVIKADGLALGKGVMIAANPGEAAMAIYRIMEQRQFGAAGDRVVIEEFLQGEECSIHALVDGRSYALFPSAQDHKRALDGDRGLNTGGMGAYTPAPILTPELERQVREQVLDPFVRGLALDGLTFKGLLYPGLMITREGPKVLEFNCRFGDPETQPYMLRLKSDLVDVLEAVIDGRLADFPVEWSNDVSVCVVMASGGYPGDYEKGKVISGVEAAERYGTVFHAGTRWVDGRLVTSGGRVLGVTATGANVRAAREKAYAAVGQIQFEGAQYRQDIAARALRG
ncbi:MAG TPA: phosphoribosylamine--glycine ligase [Chthoniobacteraceae bacterium]|jgi:phosphoribosylamine--glycine ligase|nr:phosphoribosylamine--glycine ligase [Chthoniobacteraceae bacterium]